MARQDGLATVAQVRSAGLVERRQRGRVASGEWTKLDRTVVAVSGAPQSWRRVVRAAWLSAGPSTAVSHGTAARLLGIDGYDRFTPIHVTTVGRTHHTSLRGVVVHRSTRLTDEQCTVVDGIRVVRPEVALVQITGASGPKLGRKVLDHLLRSGMSVERIAGVAIAWRRQGVRGPSMVLRMLSEVERRLPRSWFQRLAKDVLRTCGIRLVDELPIVDPDTGRTLAELDLACPELMIGIECQSWKWHSTPTARAADARRKRRLRLLGWEIVELWWDDLNRPEGVRDEIAYLISARRAA